MRDTARLGIVIPVLNDSEALARLLAWCARACAGVPVWVVDAGSQDDSAEVAHAGGAVVLRTLPGRAIQMNRGARAAIEAGCEVLWFLHADSAPPRNAIEAILSAVSRGAIGGAFKRRFDRRSLFLKGTCVLADWRGRLFGWFLGDQGIFITATAFQQLGGFPEWHAFEDLELARRMRRVGKTVMLRPAMVSSARRFRERGPIAQTLHDLRLTWAYLNCEDSPQVCIDAHTTPQRGQVGREQVIP